MADASNPQIQGGALILAAGYAARFGSDKRLHRLETGRPMLVATLERYREAFTNSAVVLRAEDDELSRMIRGRFGDDGPRIITTGSAHLGMAHSLAAGAGALRGWDYLFVGLGDMPFVEVATLRALEERMRASLARGDAVILRPCHQGTAGHPVGFPAQLFDEIAALTGDQGARAVLRAHPERLRYVELDDPGVLDDVDRPPSRLAQSSFLRQDS